MGQYDKSKLLIQAGSNLDLQSHTPSHNSPLHLVAGRPDTSFLKLFIDAGAKVNKTNVLGQTPLHSALDVFFGTIQLEAVEMLIEAGTDVARVDSNGDTVLDLVVRQTGDDMKKGQLVQLLTSVLVQPKPLQDYCRIAVRRTLCPPITKLKVQELPIPRQVVSYLLFEK